MQKNEYAHDRKPTPTVSMKHDNVKINHVNIWKRTHSAGLQFVSRNLFKRETQKKHWKDEIPASLFFGTQHGSPICQLHSKRVHRRARRPIKASHTRKRSWWKQHAVAPVPHSYHIPSTRLLLLLPTPWLSDLASSGAGRLSLTIPPWVSDRAARVAEKERKPIYNAAYTRRPPALPPNSAHSWIDVWYA